MMGKSMLLCGDNRCSTERSGDEGMKGFCKERGEEMVGRGRRWWEGEGEGEGSIVERRRSEAGKYSERESRTTDGWRKRDI